MSANVPESIPTSADPRSRRPTKRRALSPSSAHAASLEALFAKPDRDIRVPPSSSAVTAAGSGGRPTHAGSRPPEIVTNVQGSSAGAGSGEFHVYKAARRREYERLREMDAEVRREQAQEAFARDKEGRDRRDEEKTRKNRERRDKMKARKAKKGKTGGGGGDGATAATAGQARGDGGDATTTTTNGGGIKPAARAASRGMDQDEQETTGGRATVTAPASEPGLVIHDDD
ncbi:DUF1168 domain-containing protein [Cordyceps javanica]|uniref:DUF1168 domain-containing protein n=1 Tax=Cordyceps javanica TaxID=43265 RepID=A0A545UP51_9HYPO|nr:DUF1168 domain-containing protein [Cordyceps javanica]TQW02996.1 DUF1168 domain protein [Cordyceps javanica]